MCPHNPEHDRDHSGNDADPDGAVVPLRRSTARAGVTVERIETEPMTAEEYRRAVTALAALINQWKHGDKNPPHSEENAA